LDHKQALDYAYLFKRGHMNVTSYGCSQILTAENNGAKVGGCFKWDWLSTLNKILKQDHGLTIPLFLSHLASLIMEGKELKHKLKSV